ncbi:MAG: EutN/CcmL family microcompartment protein [Acidimicrobiia bacterium]
MQLSKVIGTTVSTAKDPQLGGATLLLCAPCGLDGRVEGKSRFVAVDTVGAGEGEVVLVATGSAARVSEKTRSAPTDAAVVGIVDTVRADGKTTYRKGS